ncbi:DUF6915 family protein, partial [Pseudotabrizicola sp. L79]|uniref:DUF6915 family protein n=1 Tax=Pseudotabrizicola sp. L79 TaxID=3118402 RepID=UPI0040538D70
AVHIGHKNGGAAVGASQFEHMRLGDSAARNSQHRAKRHRRHAVHIIDASKLILADFRHRALRHHAEGIFLLEQVHGKTLTLSSGRVIPTRWVGEQHVREDLGFIPSFADWARSIRAEPWMGRTQKIEAEVDPHLAMPVREVT